MYYMCRKGCTARPKDEVDRLVTAVIVELLAKPNSAVALRPSVDVTELNAARNGLRARLDDSARRSAPGTSTCSRWWPHRSH